jgi:transposase
MSSPVSERCELPDDVATLKTIINGKDSVIAELEKRVQLLLEQVTILQKYRFARSSEKWTDEDRLQLRIFDEAEAGAPAAEAPAASETEQISYTRRKKKGRKPIDDSLPRTIIIHELSEDERRCGNESCPLFGTCEKMRPVIGEQTREELEFIPAQIIVKRHVYRSYGKIDCERQAVGDEEIPEVISAPREKRLVPRSIATASLLSFIVVSKFADALPYYRLERILARIGVHISRQTICGWVIAVARACGKYLEMLHRKIREGPLINMDETTLQVLHEPNRSPYTDSYMWVIVGSDGHGRRIVMFFYVQSRSAEVGESLIAGYCGVVQSDAFKVYKRLAIREGIYDVGCWAHARRKYYEAYIGAGKKGEAAKALEFIRTIYMIENELREEELPDTEFVRERRRRVAPVLRAMRKWMIALSNSVPPKSLLGQAISYTLDEYQRLVRYLKFAFVTPDNNVAENSVRPFVVGRNNWLFNNTPLGAHASAGMYSIVETARANGLDPFHFIWRLFSELPEADTEEKLERLLPWNMEGIPPYRKDKRTRVN